MQQTASDQTSSHQTRTEQVGKSSPGETNISHGLRYYTLLVAGVAIFFGIVAWFLGAVPQPANSTQLIATTIPVLGIVDSRKGMILLLEQKNGLSRIIIKKADQASWLLVSGDDTTASSPALSPDSTVVAYLSKRDGGQISIISTVDSTRRIISADSLRKLGQSSNLGELQICPWTSIAWSRSGQDVAFFGCNAQRSFSIALVSEWSSGSPSTKIVTGSGIESPSVRDLTWLDDTHVFLTLPSVGTPASADVATLPVP